MDALKKRNELWMNLFRFFAKLMFNDYTLIFKIIEQM